MAHNFFSLTDRRGFQQQRLGAAAHGKKLYYKNTNTDLTAAMQLHTTSVTSVQKVT